MGCMGTASMLCLGIKVSSVEVKYICLALIIN